MCLSLPAGVLILQQEMALVCDSVTTWIIIWIKDTTFKLDKIREPFKKKEKKCNIFYIGGGGQDQSSLHFFFKKMV